MVEFTSKQNHTLKLDLEDRGISFHYVTGGGIYHVGQSWASIHALLARLNRCGEYSARNRSISVRMQGQELHLRFRAIKMEMEEECRFSPAETARIMDFLGRAPNLN